LELPLEEKQDIVCNIPGSTLTGLSPSDQYLCGVKNTLGGKNMKVGVGKLFRRFVNRIFKGTIQRD
jgi:hypothetical protein